MTAVNIKNKCFAVLENELEGRLDSGFYAPIFFNVIKNIKKNKNNFVKFGSLIENMAGGATPRVGGNYYADKQGIPFLRVQNITEEGLKLVDVKYIKKEVHEGMLKRSQLKSNDLVFTITGRIGSVAVIPDNFEGNINQHSVKIKLKEKVNDKEVNPFYVAIFFNLEIGRKISLRYTTGGTRPALDYEALKNLPFLLPPLKIQNQIVEIMQKAYKDKEAKEKQADELFNSIDDYVLGELGIKMPELKDKMCFSVDSGEVANRRIDPKGYLETPRKLLQAVKKSKYKFKKLSDLLKDNMAGEWGEDPQTLKDDKDYVLVNILRNTNFDNRYNLNFGDVAERFILKNKFEKIKLKAGDILIEKSGGSPIQPVGRVALIEKIEGKYAFSNFLQCFRLKEECLPEYLFSFLKALYRLNYMEYIQNQTTGIKNLIMEDYLSIPIPLPALKLQSNIAEVRKEKIKKSEDLKSEGQRLVEEAKSEVEKIILGK
jgi:restriction endonuclease S subunit